MTKLLDEVICDNNSEFSIINALESAILVVDQIGSIDIFEGYAVFLMGGDDQLISISGVPAELGPVTVNAFQTNSLPYLPQDCMGTDDAFAGYEDQILVVQNDAGAFYVPSFGVMLNCLNVI